MPIWLAVRNDVRHYVSPSPAMRSATQPFWVVRWGRPLVVLLIGALLIQSGPIRGLVQAVPATWGPQHQCAHAAHDVCPRNPGGPCTCAHSDPPASESKGLVLRACNGGSDALGPISVPRWQSSQATSVPAPRVSTDPLGEVHLPLSSQRFGNEVFRPPRTTPVLRLS